MNRYVLGFAFSTDGQRVVLIRKNRPAWQAGKLNGVGGKIILKENGFVAESPLTAMVREFQEETGLPTQGWQSYGRMSGPDWECILYYTFSDYVLDHVTTTTDEKIEIHNVADLGSAETLDNVAWLTQAALNHRDCPRFSIRAEYS